MLIVACDFWIFSNPRKSFHAFSGIVGKNLGKRGIFTNEILAQKMRTVKSTLAKREFSVYLPTARFYPKNETPNCKNFLHSKKESLRSKPEANDCSMKLKKMTDGIFLASIVK